MNELYLVTGAAGHLGSAVVIRLLEMGKSVRALVLKGEKNIPAGDIEICYGDVCDRESLYRFFDNKENRELFVIHCAGIVSIASGYYQKIYDVNVTGTKNMVDLCLEYKVKKLVYTSSVHAIPEKPKGETIKEVYEFNPDEVVGLYAKTKSEATAYVLAAVKKGLCACVVHPSGIIGPFDNGRSHSTTLITDFYKSRLVAGIKGGYDFVDVRDVANGVISTCEKGNAGECYILSNEYYTVKDILYMLHEVTGKKEIKTFLPLWFVKFTAQIAEFYYKILRQPPLYTAYSIYTLTANAKFSHEKATRELSYSTRNMKQTLKDTVEWLQSKGII